MLFTNPIWLWALSGLSIPVAIHLLSRKEGQVIYIGSIRHLQETSTQQFKGIRLNELLLLALRCLLIIFFVLILSGLSFNKEQGNEAPWVLVEKGLEKSSEVKSQIEKFEKEGYEIRILTSGFPLLADSTRTSSPISYRELVDNLNKNNFSAAVIFSRNTIAGFSGLKSSLPSNVKWISIPLKPTEFKATSYPFKDSIVTRTGFTSSDKTYFTTQTSPNVNGDDRADKTIRILLVSDKDYQYDKKIIEASIQAVEKDCRINIDLINTTPREVKTENIDWVIWLANQKALGLDSIKTIQLSLETENNMLVQKQINCWVITKRLNEEVALKENLTLSLASILIPSDGQKIAEQNDRRMIPDSLAWNNSSERNKLTISQTQTGDSYLIALLLVTLLVERILAYHKNQ